MKIKLYRNTRVPKAQVDWVWEGELTWAGKRRGYSHSYYVSQGPNCTGQWLGIPDYMPWVIENLETGETIVIPTVNEVQDNNISMDELVNKIQVVLDGIQVDSESLEYINDNMPTL